MFFHSSLVKLNDKIIQTGVDVINKLQITFNLSKINKIRYVGFNVCVLYQLLSFYYRQTFKHTQRIFANDQF